MKNLLTNKKLLIGIGIFVVLTILLLATGILKFEASFKRNDINEGLPSNSQQETTVPQNTPTKEVMQQEKLASRATQFSDKEGTVSFSIRLPVGWSTAENSKVNFVAGSMTPEKLSNGKEFTVNLNAVIAPHESSMQTFEDYQKLWKDEMLSQYPSMEFVADDTTKINGMDVYILEVNNNSPDGTLLRQVQYVFYVDKDIALALTGTSPDESWEKYKTVIKESFESIEKVTGETVEPTL